MLKLNEHEFWFVTGSQHLYGPDTLKQVDKDSKAIAEGLDAAEDISCKVVFKPVLTTSAAIKDLCAAANSDPKCAGIITWMHTFSPAKMWITGLSLLQKPMLHFHTQFNRDIPWDTIDMDFMNLNQSAHGDREFGFINARMRTKRKVVVGHWQDTEVHKKIGTWMNAAAAFAESKVLRVARFGDNMRDVAVTEGDKVETEIKFGWSVNGYGIAELVKYVDSVTDAEIEDLLKEYDKLYDFTADTKEGGKNRDSVREQAKIEVGIRNFLEAGGFSAFTTTFEDLNGLKQLPGLAAQHLMAEGYGFGAEGDWKTAALLRLMKIMAQNKATSFMEDYTYNFEKGNEMILGSHMLEVCPTIAEGKPVVEVHPLGIGGKADPARLVFTGKEGAAVCASLIDMGERFRLIVNSIDAVKVEKDMPKLPVARTLWKPQPSLKEGAEAWILAGGAHHTSFSYEVSQECLLDFAEMMGIECVLIDNNTNILNFRNELRINDLVWKFTK